MSNELSILKNRANLPAHVIAKEDTVGSKLAGGALGVKRISIRGGVWRLMAGNEELGVNDSRTLNVVIVDAAPSVYRTYYAKKYVEGENMTPACWSTDSKTPAGTVPAHQRQADTCNNCPQNIKGSAEGDRRACRIQHRVAVALPEDPEGDLFQMIFPATSLLGEPKNGYSPLRAYAKLLTQNNVRMGAVVTEMKFDTDSATPKVMFKAVDFVDESTDAILSQRVEAGDTAPLLDMSFVISGDESEEEEAGPEPAPEPPKLTAKPAKSGARTAAATGKGTRHPGFESMSAKQFLALDTSGEREDSDDEGPAVSEPVARVSEKPAVVDQKAKLQETLARFRRPTA